MNKYHIYKHTSKTTNKSYIGITNNLTRRWTRHCSDARRGSKLKFHNAIRKQGHDNWIHEILCIAFSEDDARHLEPILIEDHNTLRDGYNLAEGGGYIPTKRGKEHHLYGKKRSPAVRQKISRNHADVTGSKNSNAKAFQLLTPSGEQYIITGGLKKFCKESKIGFSTVCRQLHLGIKPKSGSFVGWEIKYYD